MAEVEGLAEVEVEAEVDEGPAFGAEVVWWLKEKIYLDFWRFYSDGRET